MRKRPQDKANWTEGGDVFNAITGRCLKTSCCCWLRFKSIDCRGKVWARNEDLATRRYSSKIKHGNLMTQWWHVSQWSVASVVIIGIWLDRSYDLVFDEGKDTHNYVCCACWLWLLKTWVSLQLDEYIFFEVAHAPHTPSLRFLFLSPSLFMFL